MTTEEAIEMFVGALVLDPNTQAPVVVLKDESGEVCLPIWIGVTEATSIASAIKQVAMARPLTHDLMYDVLIESGMKVERVVITELKDSTYYAELILSVGDKVMIFDSRPSDAIAIAVRASAPIYVAQKVLDQAKVTFTLPPGLIEPPVEEGAVDDLEGEGDTIDGEGGSPDLRNVDKDQWSEILDNLDPDDFKYKM